MSRLVHANGPDSLRVVFHNMGISGELTEDMLARFDRDAISSHPDVVIILGGSNDLGWGINPETISSNLAEMYDASLSTEVQPVACTVPSVLGYDEGIPSRLELNRLIQVASGVRKMICVDLFAATGDAHGRLKKAYSNDGLHLSSMGYKAMADAIFAGAVSPIVSRSLRETSPT